MDARRRFIEQCRLEKLLDDEVTDLLNRGEAPVVTQKQRPVHVRRIADRIRPEPLTRDWWIDMLTAIIVLLAIAVAAGAGIGAGLATFRMLTS